MTNSERSSRSPVDTLRTLVSQIETSDIEEVELKWPGGRVRVIQEANPIFASGGVAPGEALDDATIAINAPLTGVYYARSAPDQPAFVEPGAMVTTGQVVALIETMKLFNEVVSEVEGRVKRITAVEGDVVEKDQPLIHLVPAEKE